jgi:DegV family protein with EDD domain
MTHKHNESLKKLDSQQLHHAIRAGIQEVILRQDYLNHINVYPVPDRDTGTNMALTLNTINEEMPHNPPNHVGQMLEKVADAALNGSRGNSGAIMAQFFQGLSEGAKDKATLNVKDFSQAVTHARDWAYSAISNPQEGTILTILSTLSDSLKQQAKRGASDFKIVLNQALQDCQTACLTTANGLKEMKRAKVVDAGAQGFVDFLKGMSEFLEKGHKFGFSDALSVQPFDQVDDTVSEYIDSKYRYCTECIIEGDNIDKIQLRTLLDHDSDSLVIAGSAKKTKVHIHTNEPQAVFDLCAQFGTIRNNKADDMIAQQQHINHKHARIAIVADSGADIPDDLIADLDIYVIPLSISFGKKNYIDKVSLNSEEFFDLLKKSDTLPTSSQPPIGEFNRIYQYLNSHHESIISIHISSGLSGTYEASLRAAKRVHSHRISNIDSGSVSGGEGLIVIAAAIAAKNNQSHNQILKEIDYAKKNTQMFALIPDLTYVAKGGRLSPIKQRLLEFFKLSPIANVKPTGKLGIASVLIGYSNLTEKFANFICKKVQKGKRYRVLFLYADNRTQALQLQSLILKQCPEIVEHYMTACSALIGVYAGPEALEVALMELPNEHST